MQKLAIYKKYITIRLVNMQIILNIIKKTSQLKGLKNSIILKKQNNQYSFTDSKYSPDIYKVLAINKKKKNIFLAETRLTGDKIKKIIY